MVRVRIEGEGEDSEISESLARVSEYQWLGLELGWVRV